MHFPGRLWRLFFFLTLVVAAAFPAMAASLGPLTIHTSDGKAHVFTVEMATTDAEREYGLMNRPSMDVDHGMLFDFGSEQPIYMWMKNTLIPLDMIFIDRTGKVVGVAARAVPESTEIIPSPGPIRAVLEVNGGVADRIGLKVGDRVEHSMFPAKN
ncbi:MAG TPA: DUF192 domain-containing protein [Magnetospirillaceae bacterium]